MKKSLVITLFLVLSSFFFISINEVEAYEINIENLDMINEDFFKLKELSEEYISSSSEYDNFIIEMTERIKKSLIPMKIGTRLCVLRCHPNWQNKFARLCDVLSYVPHCNGCAPSATTCKGFRAALISPFTLRLSAAISPSATL